MAPATRNPIPEQRPPGVRKRILAASVASTDNVDAGAIKRRKLEALAALRQRQQRSREGSNKSASDDEPDPQAQTQNSQTPSQSLDSEAGESNDVINIPDSTPEPLGSSECDPDDGDEEEAEVDDETDEAERREPTADPEHDIHSPSCIQCVFPTIGYPPSTPSSTLSQISPTTPRVAALTHSGALQLPVGARVRAVIGELSGASLIPRTGSQRVTSNVTRLYVGESKLYAKPWKQKWTLDQLEKRLGT